MKKYLFIILSLANGCFFFHAQNINTIAGGGSNGIGDGGLAAVCQLNIPRDVAIDGAGNIYIVETNGARVRKINVTTGIINTIAGNGSGGFNGDNLLATSSSMSAPWGIAVDGSGNVFIADRQNNLIRKISASTGSMTILAGIAPNPSPNGGYNGDGIPANTAKINNPCGIAIDAIGNIFFADSYNNRVRKITAATGVISTLVGDGTNTSSGDGGPAATAGIGEPVDIAMDVTGNLYIACQGQNRIRKVDATTGNISTIAGNGGTGFSGDGGPGHLAQVRPNGLALDASSNNLYVSDQQNSRVRIINLSTNIINTVGGSGAIGFSGDAGPAIQAQFNGITGLTLNSLGEIFICDATNGRVRKIDSPTATGTNEILNHSNNLFNVYPNPFSLSSAIIHFQKSQANATIQLNDLAGKKLKADSFSGTEFILEKGMLEAGIYFISVKSIDGTIVTKKLIIE